MAILWACDDVRPQEEKATIVTYDASKTICGVNWVIQGKGKQLRSPELPKDYQQANLDVWIKYIPNATQPSSQCTFIKLISIRRR
jgi:hypothetical protein